MNTKEFLSELRRYGKWPMVKGRVFMWSPVPGLISYDPRRIDTDQGRLALLHELAHAILGHGPRSESRDHQENEVQAWNLAQRMAGELGVEIDEAYVRRRIAGTASSGVLDTLESSDRPPR